MRHDIPTPEQDRLPVFSYKNHFDHMWANSRGDLVCTQAAKEIIILHKHNCVDQTIKTHSSTIVTKDPVQQSIYFQSNGHLSKLDLESFCFGEAKEHVVDDQVISACGFGSGTLMLLAQKQGILKSRSGGPVEKVFDNSQATQIKELSPHQVFLRYRARKPLYQHQLDDQQSQTQQFWKVINLERSVCTLDLSKPLLHYYDNIVSYNRNCLFVSTYDLDNNAPELAIWDRRIGKKVIRLGDTQSYSLQPETARLLSSNQIVCLANTPRDRWNGKLLLADVRFNRLNHVVGYNGRVGHLFGTNQHIYPEFYTVQARQVLRSVYKPSL